SGGSRGCTASTPLLKKRNGAPAYGRAPQGAFFEASYFEDFLVVPFAGSFAAAGAFSTLMAETYWCSPLSLSMQVRETFSPAFSEARWATALPCTGAVLSSPLTFTVMVLAVASAETTSPSMT